MTSDDSSTSAPASSAGQTSADRRGDAARTGDELIDRLLALVGLKQSASIRDDLQDALSESAAGTDFSPQERAMLKNVLALRTHRVDDVMVPRADIVAVPLDSTLGDLLRVFRTAGHSRLPVYRRDARRPARHGPHPRLPRLPRHRAPRPRQSLAPAQGAGWTRPTSARST